MPTNKFLSVVTDGAPAMFGRDAGLVGLLKSNPKVPDFLPIHCIHCITHPKHILAKYFK
jgi:hypothetical protein